LFIKVKKKHYFKILRIFTYAYIAHYPTLTSLIEFENNVCNHSTVRVFDNDIEFVVIICFYWLKLSFIILSINNCLTLSHQTIGFVYNNMVNSYRWFMLTGSCCLRVTLYKRLLTVFNLKKKLHKFKFCVVIVVYFKNCASDIKSNVFYYTIMQMYKLLIN